MTGKFVHEETVWLRLWLDILIGQSAVESSRTRDYLLNLWPLIESHLTLQTSWILQWTTIHINFDHFFEDWTKIKYLLRFCHLEGSRFLWQKPSRMCRQLLARDAKERTRFTGLITFPVHSAVCTFRPIQSASFYAVPDWIESTTTALPLYDSFCVHP